MRKYMVYIDDGTDCYKLAIPAENEEKAREYAQGNGEIIAVKDVTDIYSISGDSVAEALKYDAKLNEFEIDFVIRALREINICK